MRFYHRQSKLVRLMPPEDNHNGCRMTFLMLWVRAAWCPSYLPLFQHSVRGKCIALCGLHFVHCFPHPRKLSFQKAVILLCFIMHLFTTVEWSVVPMHHDLPVCWECCSFCNAWCLGCAGWPGVPAACQTDEQTLHLHSYSQVLADSLSAS